jgi:hypothetical protein
VKHFLLTSGHRASLAGKMVDFSLDSELQSLLPRVPLALIQIFVYAAFAFPQERG